MSTATSRFPPATSWGYIADDVMADRDGRAAVVEKRRLYLVAQMTKRGLEPVGEVVVTRLADKADEAPPGCSGYRFELHHRDGEGELSATPPHDVADHTKRKVFFTRSGTEYVQEESAEPRLARPGERYAYVADLVHARRWPHGRQYTRPL